MSTRGLAAKSRALLDCQSRGAQTEGRTCMRVRVPFVASVALAHGDETLRRHPSTPSTWYELVHLDER